MWLIFVLLGCICLALLDWYGNWEYYQIPDRDKRLTVVTGIKVNSEFQPNNIFIEFWDGSKFVSKDFKHWEQL